MRKTLVILFVFLAVSVLFSGCSLQPFQPVDSLIKPPAYSGKDTELLSAFYSSVSDNTVLCPPVNGTYTSAVNTVNLDKDADDEAVIFYRPKSNTESVRIHILDKTEKGWESISDFKGSGSSVDSMMLSDMNGDSALEIIVSWRVGVSSGKIVSLYAKAENQKEYKELLTEPYAVLALSDYNYDGFEDLFFICQKTTNVGNENTGNLIKLNGGYAKEPKAVVAGSVRLDSTVGTYTEIKLDGSVSKKEVYILADALKGEGQMITEVIHWDMQANELKSLFSSEDSVSNAQTLRSSSVRCMDIDGDGSYEIPTRRLQLFGKSEIVVTDWMKIKNNKLVYCCSTIINEKLHYRYTFAQDDTGRIFVREETENCWIFCRQDGNECVELFSVIPIKKSQWNKQSNERYVFLTDTGEDYICAYISEDGLQQGINPDTLEEKFTKFIN